MFYKFEWWCPFYKNDTKLYIVCEDGTRQDFQSPEQLMDYARAYCASARGCYRCPIYRRLWASYEEDE